VSAAQNLAVAWAIRFWRWLPAILKGVVLVQLITTVAGLPPYLFLLANLKLTPSVPWLLPATLGWLWLFWRYAAGRGWPQGTAESRRLLLRGNRLPGRVWGWALLAGGLGIASVTGLAFLTPRLSAIPRDAFKLPFDLSSYPPWTILSILLAISAVAGVLEEAGYRGYMLSIIQRRHGWIAGIGLSGLMFFFDHHWSHAYATYAFLPFFLAISAVHGLLVYSTRSILPSIVLHTMADAIIIPVQYGLFGDFAGQPTIWVTGLDREAMICLAVMILCGAAAGLAFARLARAVRERGLGVPNPAPT
jgi:membrane protease YdiL (CAAX protease family)